MPRSGLSKTLFLLKFFQKTCTSKSNQNSVETGLSKTVQLAQSASAIGAAILGVGVGTKWAVR